MYTNWADGPAMVTQCPVVPKTSFTHRFKVTGQEGTLFYHAHLSALRESLYGAIIIRPRRGQIYPFPKPHKEVPILLGKPSLLNSNKRSSRLLSCNCSGLNLTYMQVSGLVLMS